MIANTSPAVTIVPFSLSIWINIPDSGAVTSKTTLSVSRSIKASFFLTNSPAFLCQFTNVASDTDSG